MSNKTDKTTITMIVTKDLKDLVRARAEATNRSMTNYIEWLVLRDCEGLAIDPSVLPMGEPAKLRTFGDWVESRLATWLHSAHKDA